MHAGGIACEQRASSNPPAEECPMQMLCWDPEHSERDQCKPHDAFQFDESQPACLRHSSLRGGDGRAVVRSFMPMHS